MAVSQAAKGTVSAGVSWRELGKVLLTSPEDESGRKPAPAGVPGLGPAPQPGLVVTLSAPVALGKEGSQLQGAHLRHPPRGGGAVGTGAGGPGTLGALLLWVEIWGRLCSHAGF